MSHLDDHKQIPQEAGFKKHKRGIPKRSSKVKEGERKGGLAIRRSGAGRKDLCAEMKSGVKHWLEAERSHGHFVDQKDLYEEYIDQINASVNQQLQQVRRLVQGSAEPASNHKIVEFQVIKRKARILELRKELRS